MPPLSEQDHVIHVEKRDETASNADTGYETASVTSASSSSQIMKVRHIDGELIK